MSIFWIVRRESVHDHLHTDGGVELTGLILIAYPFQAIVHVAGGGWLVPNGSFTSATDASSVTGTTDRERMAATTFTRAHFEDVFTPSQDGDVVAGSEIVPADAVFNDPHSPEPAYRGPKTIREA